MTTEIVDPATTLQRVRLALAYGIPFNREALERHLAARKELGGWTPDERHAAFLIAFHSSDPKRIVDFFDAHHDDLFAPQTDLGRAALAAIEIEVFARTGRFEDARRHIALHRGTDLTPDQAADIEELVAHIQKGDEVENLRQRYSQSQNLTDLRLLVGALRVRRELKQLSDYAPHLARATKAIEDFDLAIKSLFDSKRYCELLELAENLPDLQKLDDDYAAFKGWAFYQLGRIREARETARYLLARRDVVGDRELAVVAAIETGDWGNLQAILAREVSRADTLAPSDLIRLARLALEAGSPYVDQFRDAALRKAPDDPEINLAGYTLAIERGSEYQGSEAHTWFQKAIVRSGPEGPVRSVSMREVIEQVPDWNKHRETVDQMLRRGDVPFFIAAKAVRRQVIDLTLGQALRNTDANDRRIKYSVLAFSGAQPEIDIMQAKSVALDITAIITLDYIGLLEKVLERFDQIVIAPRTLSMLFLERQFLKFHQPSQMAKAQRLQALIAAGGLKVMAPEAGSGSARSREIGLELATLLAAAEREGGLVVRSAPVFKLGSFLEEWAEMDAYGPVLTDTLAVISFLSSHGKLDSEVQERAERYLNQAAAGWEKAQAIGPQSKLYLDALSITYLDHVGVLEILARSVPSVFIHADLESDTRNLLRHGRHTEELLAAIERIRTVIAVQVEAGRVQFSARRAADKTEDEERGDTLASSPTLDLMSDLSGIDAVVADDRCLNKLPNWTDGASRNALATSSLSILTALKADGQLDEQAYWRARHRLRAAGYYAVPLDAAELLHHLAHASIADGKIRETPELKAARESLSLPRINDTFVPADQPWLNRARYAVYKAIHEGWLSSPDLDRARARADWLWSIIPNPLEWCLSPEVEADWAAARQQTAVQISLMMVLIDASGERKRRYFAWLEEAVVQPLQEMHPEIWRAAFEFLKSYITQLIEARDQDAHGAA